MIPNSMDTSGNLNDGALKIISVDFEDNGNIPQKFYYENENLIPTFKITNIPKETKSLAIIMEDTETAVNYTHWMVYNIDPALDEIGGEEQFGQTGKNSRTLKEYQGVNPRTGRHTYRFTIHTLRETLDNVDEFNSEELRDLIEGSSFERAHIEVEAEKIGSFSIA